MQNNPIRYKDPSGHDVGCAGTDASNCSRWNHVKDRNLGYKTKSQKVNINSSNDRECISGNYRKEPIQLLNNGIIISKEHGLCINWGDVGCSGGTNYEEWLKNEYYPMYWNVYIHQDLLSFSNASQNASFLFSFTGTVFTIMGIPQGHILFTNNLEAIASWSSTGFTLVDDFVYQKTNFVDNEGLTISKGSAQSLIASAIGQIVSSAPVDVFIDYYQVRTNYGMNEKLFDFLNFSGIKLLGVQVGDK